MRCRLDTRVSLLAALALVGCVAEDRPFDNPIELDRDEDGLVGAYDCNDDNPAISPSASEVCDGMDNDCDSLVDDLDDSLDTSTGSPWHPDGDGDGWGASDETVMACIAPEGFGQDTSDCDDSNPEISPDAEELCNGIDDDCDTRIDDLDDSLASTGASFWRDADNDGWGTPEEWACQDYGFGWASVTGDCDDDRASVNPDAAELCDGRDNDCDDDVDEDKKKATEYVKQLKASKARLTDLLTKCNDIMNVQEKLALREELASEFIERNVFGFLLPVLPLLGNEGRLLVELLFRRLMQNDYAGFGSWYLTESSATQKHQILSVDFLILYVS